MWKYIWLIYMSEYFDKLDRVLVHNLILSNDWSEECDLKLITMDSMIDLDIVMHPCSRLK
jgi:hypothetical protein